MSAALGTVIYHSRPELGPIRRWWRNRQYTRRTGNDVFPMSVHRYWDSTGYPLLCPDDCPNCLDLADEQHPLGWSMPYPNWRPRF